MAAVEDPDLLSQGGGNLRRRRHVDRIMRGSAAGAAIFAVALLLIVVASVAIKGASQLSISFLFKDPVQTLQGIGGGIANAIVGSAIVVGFAAAMALPLGVLVAIYLTEFANRSTARAIRLVLDLLNGMPSIVIAVFCYGLIVAVQKHQSGFAASVALAIIMIPLIARTTSEMLTLVPRDLRDASYALGISRWRTILGIVLPSAVGGILTGAVLAIARAAGETAPMLLLNSVYGNGTSVNLFSAGVPNIPFTIYSDSESAVPALHATAWGAAFVLVVIILVGNLGARTMLARQRRKMLAR
jgi:phosphate transport system permease protein